MDREETIAALKRLLEDFGTFEVPASVHESSDTASSNRVAILIHTHTWVDEEEPSKHTGTIITVIVLGDKPVIGPDNPAAGIGLMLEGVEDGSMSWLATNHRGQVILPSLPHGQYRLTVVN